MDLTFTAWLLGILPVIILISGILLLKWKASKSGAVAWLAALGIGYYVFQSDARMLVLASGKGMSLAIYVLLIVWGAVFLYNLANEAGAIQVIGLKLETVSDDRLIQCLLFAWCFSSVLQGLAGFGVPVAVVAPLMVAMGFRPVVAAATCLVGHSWSISYGSMGSSYNAIQLVTGIPGEQIGPVMALLFSIGIFMTGFGVAHIYGGWKSVKKAFFPIVITSVNMSVMLWVLNVVGMAQLGSLLSAATGCITLIIWSSFKRRRVQGQNFERPIIASKSAMSIWIAGAPYFLLVILSILGQIPLIQNILKQAHLGLDYPAVETGLGYSVAAVSDYSKITLYSHPGPLLLISAVIGYFIYIRFARGVDRSIFRKSLQTTVKKCVPMSVGISFMVMMALVMIDSGMTYIIALGLARVFNRYYGIVAPFIGTLGTFITGSNTNSNVMFGALQYETAVILGINGVVIAAAQSLGASLGVSISPSALMMSTSNVNLSGQEATIMKITIRYCLITTLVVGLVVWLVSTVLKVGV